MWKIFHRVLLGRKMKKKKWKKKSFMLECIYLDLWCGLLNATSENIFKDVFSYVEEINEWESKGERRHRQTCLAKEKALIESIPSRNFISWINIKNTQHDKETLLWIIKCSNKATYVYSRKSSEIYFGWFFLSIKHDKSPHPLL